MVATTDSNWACWGAMMGWLNSALVAGCVLILQEQREPQSEEVQ